MKSNQLIVAGEIIAVCCVNHVRHTSTLCGQNAGFLTVKAGSNCSYHWALNIKKSNELSHHSMEVVI
jgi:hypothetical protein